MPTNDPRNEAPDQENPFRRDPTWAKVAFQPDSQAPQGIFPNVQPTIDSVNAAVAKLSAILDGVPAILKEVQELIDDIRTKGLSLNIKTGLSVCPDTPPLPAPGPLPVPKPDDDTPPMQP